MALAADSGDVGGDGLDLHSLDVAVFHPGDAGRADAHRLSDLGLGQAVLLAHLREVGADIAGAAGLPGSPSWYAEATTVLDLDGNPLPVAEQQQMAEVTVGADGLRAEQHNVSQCSISGSKPRPTVPAWEWPPAQMSFADTAEIASSSLPAGSLAGEGTRVRGTSSTCCSGVRSGCDSRHCRPPSCWRA